LSVPSSPSATLSSFFSNNKPSLLSQSLRQQQIQQSMQNKTDTQTKQQNKSDTSLMSPSTPLAQPNVQPKPAQTTPKSEELKEGLAKEIKEALDTSLCPKFKNSKTSIEALLLDDNDYSNYLNKGACKILNSKNINTIGDLCSLNAAELNNLPFRLPKQTNFMAFIQKYENSLSLDQTAQQTTNEQELNVLAKLSATSLPFIGSVEEEMAKLEASNCLDTSIECEAFQIEAQQILNTNPAPSAVTVEKNAIVESKEDKPKEKEKEIVNEEKESDKSMVEHSNMDVDSENKTQQKETETVTNEAQSETQFDIISGELQNELDKNLSTFINLAKTKIKPESTTMKDLYDLYGLDNNLDELHSNFNDALKSYRSKIKEIVFNNYQSAQK